MSTVHYQQYLSTVYTQYVFVIVVLLAVSQQTANRTSVTNTYCCVHSAEVLLMMDSGMAETCTVKKR